MTDQKEIIQAIADHLGIIPEDIDKEASLKDDLDLGPIELNDLLNYLAHKFDITFSQEDTEELNTVGDLVLLVEDNLIE